MARSNIKAVFENDVQTVWNVITDVKNYIWRTDLSKTEIISDKQFIEYTKNGYATTFTITLFEPYKRWEFDVENSNIKGHWIGIFTQKGEKTEIDAGVVVGKPHCPPSSIPYFTRSRSSLYSRGLANSNMVRPAAAPWIRLTGIPER